MIASVLELASKTIAVILVLIKANKVRTIGSIRLHYILLCDRQYYIV